MESRIMDLKNMVSKCMDLPVYFIACRHTSLAVIMKKSVSELRISEVNEIDKKGYYSTREKAEEAMRKDVIS